MTALALVAAAPLAAAKPARYRVGDVLRYGPGPTALFQVTQVFDGNGDSGPVYYGRHCAHGWAAMRHAHVARATAPDVAIWRAHALARRDKAGAL